MWDTTWYVIATGRSQLPISRQYEGYAQELARVMGFVDTHDAVSHLANKRCTHNVLHPPALPRFDTRRV
jgi:hypothetical protein